MKNYEFVYRHFDQDRIKEHLTQYIRNKGDYEHNLVLAKIYLDEGIPFRAFQIYRNCERNGTMDETLKSEIDTAISYDKQLLALTRLMEAKGDMEPDEYEQKIEQMVHSGVKIAADELADIERDKKERDNDKIEKLTLIGLEALPDYFSAIYYANAVIKNESYNRYETVAALYKSVNEYDSSGRYLISIAQLYYSDDYVCDGWQADYVTAEKYLNEAMRTPSANDAIVALCEMYINQTAEDYDVDDDKQLNFLLNVTNKLISVSKRILDSKLYKGYHLVAGLYAYGMGDFIKKDEQYAKRLLIQGIDNGNYNCIYTWMDCQLSDVFEEPVDIDFTRALIKKGPKIGGKYSDSLRYERSFILYLRKKQQEGTLVTRKIPFKDNGSQIKRRQPLGSMIVRGAKLFFTNKRMLIPVLITLANLGCVEGVIRFTGMGDSTGALVLTVFAIGLVCIFGAIAGIRMLASKEYTFPEKMFGIAFMIITILVGKYLFALLVIALIVIALLSFLGITDVLIGLLPDEWVSVETRERLARDEAEYEIRQDVSEKLNVDMSDVSVSENSTVVKSTDTKVNVDYDSYYENAKRNRGL